MIYTNKTFFRSFFIFLIFSLLLFAAPLSAEEKIDYKDIRGPKIDTLALIIISNSDSQVMAAEAGEIDIVGDITRASDIDRLSLNKKLSMSLARGLHAFFLLLNDQTPPW
ncbi:MAG: ABC transporter substrate-binding protein, partial [Synergistes sp.]|nr:ABC transporter substrate-binding protein [Synergistes sp.]